VANLVREEKLNPTSKVSIQAENAVDLAIYNLIFVRTHLEWIADADLRRFVHRTFVEAAEYRRKYPRDISKLTEKQKEFSIVVEKKMREFRSFINRGSQKRTKKKGNLRSEKDV
jgi:hypothetical protein